MSNDTEVLTESPAKTAKVEPGPKLLWVNNQSPKPTGEARRVTADSPYCGCGSVCHGEE
jgi:hypothetical protein